VEQAGLEEVLVVGVEVPEEEVECCGGGCEERRVVADGCGLG
jgi:hypothetical protein